MSPLGEKGASLSELPSSSQGSLGGGSQHGSERSARRERGGTSSRSRKPKSGGLQQQTLGGSQRRLSASGAAASGGGSGASLFVGEAGPLGHKSPPSTSGASSKSLERELARQQQHTQGVAAAPPLEQQSCGNVFVANIPPNISPEELYAAVCATAKAVAVDYKPDGRWAHAVVSYASSDEADKAVQSIHGKKPFAHLEALPVAAPEVPREGVSVAGIPRGSSASPNQQSLPRCQTRMNHPFDALIVTEGNKVIVDANRIASQAKRTTFTLLKDGPAGANLFLYGIPANWKEVELMKLVGCYGHVVGIRVPPAASTTPASTSAFCRTAESSVLQGVCSYSRGFGFVSFDSTEAAFNAFRDLMGQHICGKVLRVQLKKGEEHFLPDDLKGLAASAMVSGSSSHQQRSSRGEWNAATAAFDASPSTRNPLREAPAARGATQTGGASHGPSQAAAVTAGMAQPPNFFSSSGGFAVSSSSSLGTQGAAASGAAFAGDAASWLLQQARNAFLAGGTYSGSPSPPLLREGLYASPPPSLPPRFAEDGVGSRGGGAASLPAFACANGSFGGGLDDPSPSGLALSGGGFGCRGGASVSANLNNNSGMFDAEEFLGFGSDLLLPQEVSGFLSPPEQRLQSPPSFDSLLDRGAWFGNADAALECLGGGAAALSPSLDFRGLSMGFPSSAAAAVAGSAVPSAAAAEPRRGSASEAALSSRLSQMQLQQERLLLPPQQTPFAESGSAAVTAFDQQKAEADVSACRSARPSNGGNCGTQSLGTEPPSSGASKTASSGRQGEVGCSSQQSASPPLAAASSPPTEALSWKAAGRSCGDLLPFGSSRVARTLSRCGLDLYFDADDSQQQQPHQQPQRNSHKTGAASAHGELLTQTPLQTGGAPAGAQSQQQQQQPHHSHSHHSHSHHSHSHHHPRSHSSQAQQQQQQTSLSDSQLLGSPPSPMGAVSGAAGSGGRGTAVVASQGSFGLRAETRRVRRNTHFCSSPPFGKETAEGGLSLPISQNPGAAADDSATRTSAAVTLSPLTRAASERASSPLQEEEDDEKTVSCSQQQQHHQQALVAALLREAAGVVSAGPVGGVSIPSSAFDDALSVASLSSAPSSASVAAARRSLRGINSAAFSTATHSTACSSSSERVGRGSAAASVVEKEKAASPEGVSSSGSPTAGTPAFSAGWMLDRMMQMQREIDSLKEQLRVRNGEASSQVEANAVNNNSGGGPPSSNAPPLLAASNGFSLSRPTADGLAAEEAAVAAAASGGGLGRPCLNANNNNNNNNNNNAEFGADASAVGGGGSGAAAAVCARAFMGEKHREKGLLSGVPRVPSPRSALGSGGEAEGVRRVETVTCSSPANKTLGSSLPPKTAASAVESHGFPDDSKSRPTNSSSKASSLGQWL